MCSEPETECGADGIVVIVRFLKPTAGAIFVKDHFATCRSEFTNTLNATLKIALPNLQHDNLPCPGFEIVCFTCFNRISEVNSGFKNLKN